MLKVALLKLLLIFHWLTGFVHGVTGLNRCYHEDVCIVKKETSHMNKQEQSCSSTLFQCKYKEKPSSEHTCTHIEGCYAALTQ